MTREPLTAPPRGQATAAPAPLDGRIADAISVDALAAGRRTKWLGRRHEHIISCPSTNDLAAARARAGAEEGLLITAEEQTAGRGRQGRAWHSPAGANLILSLLLRPRRPPHEIPTLTLLVGGALAAVVRTAGFDVRVKWPNDLLLRGADGEWKKVAGVLTEASSEGGRVAHVVVGIGVNVNVDQFPDELADKATSLRLASGGASLSRMVLLGRVLAALEQAYDDFRARGPAAAVQLWEAHADLGSRQRFQQDGRTIEGVTTGVGPDGALELRDDDGRQHRIVSGETTRVTP